MLKCKVSGPFTAGCQRSHKRWPSALKILALRSADNAPVTRIRTAQHQVKAIELADGDILATDQLIFNGDVRALGRALLGESLAKHFQKADRFSDEPIGANLVP